MTEDTLLVKTTEDFPPVGMSFDALTISGGLTDVALSLSLCSKFFNARSFLIF